MQSIRLIARPGWRLTAEPFDVPRPRPRQALVRVTHSHVSAGTEMNYFRDNPPGSDGAPSPLGYMTVGVVEEVGAGIKGFAPGQRVLTCGHHASYCLVDLDDPGPAAWYIEPLDPAIASETAGFAVLGDVALHGVRRAALQIDERVAVFGLGMVGQLTVQLARLSGAYPIIAVDLADTRLARAAEGGATHLINAAMIDPVEAIRDITGGEGAETLFHCAPTPAILPAMMRAAADRGTVVLSGSPPGQVEIGLQAELLRRELTIVGNYELSLTQHHPYWPWTRQRNRRACLRLMKSGELQIDSLVTHVVSYTEAQAMLDMMAAGSADWLGIVFKWT